jgi:hypothetical protein
LFEEQGLVSSKIYKSFILSPVLQKFILTCCCNFTKACKKYTNTFEIFVMLKFYFHLQHFTCGPLAWPPDPRHKMHHTAESPGTSASVTSPPAVLSPKIGNKIFIACRTLNGVLLISNFSSEALRNQKAENWDLDWCVRKCKSGVQ